MKKNNNNTTSPPLCLEPLFESDYFNIEQSKKRKLKHNIFFNLTTPKCSTPSDNNNNNPISLIPEEFTPTDKLKLTKEMVDNNWENFAWENSEFGRAIRQPLIIAFAVIDLNNATCNFIRVEELSMQEFIDNNGHGISRRVNQTFLPVIVSENDIAVRTFEKGVLYDIGTKIIIRID
jgi:hypothetical protein